MTEIEELLHEFESALQHECVAVDDVDFARIRVVNARQSVIQWVAERVFTEEEATQLAFRLSTNRWTAAKFRDAIHEKLARISGNS